jgi:hypothetical protein
MKWITRERPKIDRVACPWLITRFIDAEAEFLFAPAKEVFTVAKRTGATPFDIDGAVLSHRNEKCSFDAFIEDYKLNDPELADLANIVRGADTDRLDLSPQSPGLLAISLGLSRLCLDDDHRVLAHGFVIYDALYEWLRHARGEKHGWKPGRVSSGEPAWDRLESGNVEVRIGAREVRVGGRRRVVPKKEFDLLVALVSRAGRVVSRPFLLEHVWAYQPDVSSRTLDWHVSALRRRLGPASHALKTVRGVGYSWNP